MNNRTRLSLGFIWVFLILVFCSTAQGQTAPLCNCLQWGTPALTVSGGGQVQTAPCGGTIILSTLGSYSFVPHYTCTPSPIPCPQTYSWTITGPGGTFPGSGTVINHNFTAMGGYVIDIVPHCGTHNCPECKFNIVFRPCSCGSWSNPPISMMTTSPLTSTDLLCGQSYVKRPGNFTFSASYQCSPSTCPPTYYWTWTGPTSGSSSGTTHTFSHAFTTPGAYQITVTPFCGTTQCRPCSFGLAIRP